MDNHSEFTVYFADNPLDAEEFVWLTTDMERAEALLIQRPTLYKVSKTVYLISGSQELSSLYTNLSNEEFKRIEFRTLREFSRRNAGVPRISMIAALKAEGVKA